MANSRVFFFDLKSGSCSSAVEARLLRFWKARYVKRGGMLLVDVNSTLMQATINAHRLSKFRKRLAAGTMYSIYGFDDTHHLSSFLQFLFRFVFDHFLIVYSLSHVAATLNAKVKENGEASPKPPHPDLKYLDQILTVPKRELFVEVDNDKEWLYGPLGVKLRKARTWMTMVSLSTLQKIVSSFACVSCNNTSVLRVLWHVI
ncbi:hypothetical protein Rs2_25852 [Raphanus sativus]|nr:hypothetical protein Rs2_25852 [Raphanus sativus]